MMADRIKKLYPLIEELYSECNQNSCEIQRRLEKLGNVISSMTIRQYLKDNGFKINRHGGKRVPLTPEKFGAFSDEEIEKIISLNKKFYGNTKEASEYMRRHFPGNPRKYASTTIAKIWRKEGLNLKRDFNLEDKLD